VVRKHSQVKPFWEEEKKGGGGSEIALGKGGGKVVLLPLQSDEEGGRGGRGGARPLRYARLPKRHRGRVKRGTERGGWPQ